ncbi:MAG TPA: M28 family peptidase [Thermoanaerobaculia bacterium]|nr:M28 family peptidase [Thermoanaerobaculia bacterium]
MTGRQLLLVTALLALLLAVTAWRFRGPAPLGQTAAAERFSASRAITVLGHLLQEEVPHPVGTAANRRIRERIELHFQSLGYATEVQRGFVCNATPACATVENIVAAPPGEGGPYVLLVSHYDSAAAGPGASDAGVAVAAILEVARALGPRRGVAYLITDGEEAGLLGAELFVTTPWKERVAVVVNAENRGTSGPAFLFETSRGNAGLMPAVKAIPRPAASSLFYTIYERLPNDTDVTVFKRAGLPALNFAAIGNVAYYHTPLDDLARVDPRTMQHHGDNLLAVTRALTGGFERTSGNAVFFDVLQAVVISWPERWTLWIALVSAVLLIAGSRNEPWKALILGAVLAAGAVIVAAGLAHVVAWLAHVRAGGSVRLAYPQAVIAAMWLSGIAAALIVFGIPRKRQPRAFHAGVGLVWHAVAIALAVTLPGPSYLVLVPAVAFTLCSVLRASPVVAAATTSIAAGVLLFPLAIFLYPAMGRGGLVPTAAIIALVATTITPLLGRPTLRPAGFTAAAAVGGALITIALPAFTEWHPRRASIDHELPEPAVQASAVRKGDVVTIRVASNRAADRLLLDFGERVEVLRVNGVAPAPPNPGRVWRGAMTVYGSEAVVEVRAPQGVPVTATDLTYGLPPEAERAARRRDALHGVPSYRGDVTISRMRLTL